MDINAIIAAKKFGKGGGSVPKPLTYDYMPEGYPKKETNKVIHFEQTIEEFELKDYNPDMLVWYAMALPSGLASDLEKESFTVVWDGVEYVCQNKVAQTYAAQTPAVVVLGSDVVGFVGTGGANTGTRAEVAAEFEIADSGEPFSIRILSTGAVRIYTDAGPGPHTLVIYTESEAVKPIAYDYMPEGYPYKKVETGVLFAKEGLVSGSPVDEFATPLSIVVGDEYTVVYNGVTYNCVAGEVNAGVVLWYLGDIQMLDGTVGTGEPFLVMGSNDQYVEDGYYWMAAAFDGSETFDISITGAKTEIVTMSPELLPPMRKVFVARRTDGMKNLHETTEEEFILTFTVDDVVEAYKAGYLIVLEIQYTIGAGDQSGISNTILPLNRISFGGFDSVAEFGFVDVMAVYSFEVSTIYDDGFKWTVTQF